MTNIIEPTNYRCELTPFSQRLLQYDLEQSKLFLTRSANFFLNAFTYGHNPDEIPFADTTTSLGVVLPKRYQDRTECILDGFKTVVSYDNSIVTVICSPGTCIIDTTLISIFEPITLTLDLNDVKITNGFLILSISYKWNESILENKPIFKLTMVNPDGTVYLPENVNWNPMVDRLIITKFTIESLSIYNHYPIPIHKINKEFILVKNSIYEICPLINIIYETRNFISEYITKKITYYIDDISKWNSSLIAPFITDTPDEFSFAKIDISIINKKDCIVQCYINDMKIESACIQHINNLELLVWMPNWFVQLSPLQIMKVIIIG